MNNRDENKTGGPAFPSNNDANKYYNWLERGMTLRDYFAAKAMQAMIQASATLPGDDEHSYERAVYCGVNAEISCQNSDKDPPEQFTWAEMICVESYEIADQMLKARMKP